MHSKADLLPLNPAQQWLISYFPSPYEWYDRMLFTIENSISISVAEKAFESLILRHEGLRTIFHQKNSSWQQQLLSTVDLNKAKPLLFSAQNIDETLYPNFRNELCLTLCKEFDISIWPLCKIVIVKRTSIEFDVIFLFHHIIIDYFSCITLFKEFCLIYFSLLKDEFPTLSDFASNTEYARKIELQTDAFAKQKWKGFWSETLKGYISPFKFKHGPSFERYAAILEKIVSSDQIEILLHKAKQIYRSKSLHCVLVAPLYRALHEMTNHEQIIISHKLHGRNIEGNSTSFYSAVGNFAINVPLLGYIHEKISWSHLIHDLEQKLAELPLNGLSYDLAHFEQNSSYYPDHSLTPVRFNFLGSISFIAPQGMKISFKEIARRIVNPLQPLTAYIEFFIHFFEKSLHLQVVYDSDQISHDFLKKLVDTYLYYLSDLINDLKIKVNS